MIPLLAIGSAAVDIKARLARTPLRTTDVPGRVSLKAGGVARNIAENLARLGLPVVFAGIMGDDPQARLLIELSRAAGLEIWPLTRSLPPPTDLTRSKLPAALPTATLNVMLGPDHQQLAGVFSGDILEALQPADLEPLRADLQLTLGVICDGGLPGDVLSALCEMTPADTLMRSCVK